MPYLLHSARRVFFASAVVALSLVWFAANTHAQGSTARITVQLVDTAGAAIRGGQVRVSGVAAPAISDVEGRVEVHGIPAGSRLVTFSATGFATERALIRFDRGSVIPVRVSMRPAVVLDRLNVLGARRALARNGFYERQRAGLGQFVTRAGIDSAGAFGNDLAFLFRRMRGFTVDYLPNGRFTLTARRGMDSLSGRCVAAIFVDHLESSMEVLTNLSPSEVEAIEVYADAAATPQQYNRGTGCGAIVVWTRRR